MAKEVKNDGREPVDYELLEALEEYWKKKNLLKQFDTVVRMHVSVSFEDMIKHNISVEDILKHGIDHRLCNYDFPLDANGQDIKVVLVSGSADYFALSCVDGARWFVVYADIPVSFIHEEIGHWCVTDWEDPKDMFNYGFFVLKVHPHWIKKITIGGWVEDDVEEKWLKEVIVWTKK